jgi:putative FmdB family regulatory protein
MPLYEYKCHSCGDVFEMIQKFSDAPLAVHETCGGTVERLISPSALQFKGSGWYVTDYGKGNRKQQKADSSNGDGKSDNGKGSESSAKSESSGKSESPGKSESSGKSETSSKSEPSSKAPAPSPSKSDSK